ncbi:MAG: SUMF1/EgtB/PvdO family nonheme iron enzyme [Verrucomicrobia bacterium]|nr:SUMF1/EgtB/PvdO family nonheme iron enzyme [Verrucomicrobiota bacterium]
MRLLRHLLFTLVSISLPVSAQKPEEVKEYTSSLGSKFVTVPGSSVFFATQETTVGQWQAFVQKSGYKWDYKPHFDQGADHPAVGITLQDARAFCSWLTDIEREAKQINVAQSYRLPTQDEWDAAVVLTRTRKPDLTVDEKVQDERTFPWGMRWPPPPKSGNFAEGEIAGYEDGFPYTSPVGQFTPSTDGLYDLSGNVWEWCWDAEVRAEQEGVLRGGSWAYFRAECLTSAYTYRVPGELRMPTIGFRCVFEDKKRSAEILAMAESVKTKIRNERREQIIGGSVDKAEMEAMKKKLLGGDAASTIPDPSKLTPVASGKDFENSLGMLLVPFGEKKLAGKMEVRMQDFETWLKSTDRSWDEKPSFLLGGSHPAAGLSWTDAQDFCEWLTKRDRTLKLIPETATYRLPSDAEWSEMAGLKDEVGADPAAKSGANKTHYPWSATGTFPPPAMSTNLDAPRLANFTDSYSYTAPVMNEAANGQGIQGLGGNVSEWCADSWPGADTERVIRGGSWLSFDKDQLLTSTRRHTAQDKATPDIGFRIMLELTTP